LLLDGDIYITWVVCHPKGALKFITQCHGMGDFIFSNCVTPDHDFLHPIRWSDQVCCAPPFFCCSHTSNTSNYQLQWIQL